MSQQTTLNLIQECLRENYGLEGQLSRLPGENLNFRLTGPTGIRHVVKIVDEETPPEAVVMEFEAIEHAIKANFELELPKITVNIHKKIETRIERPYISFNRLRVIHFIEGKILQNIPDISDILLKNCGFSLAGFQIAMRGFDHPAAHRKHRWHMLQVDQHRDKIQLLEDRRRRDLLRWGFTTWRDCSEVLHRLPRQFIHGDAHDENFLVRDGRIVGLVDFGDSCSAPPVCDLAITLTYLMMAVGRPLEAVAAVTAGWRERMPLSEEETGLLYPLICGRLSLSIAISNWRRRIDPENPNWFNSEGGAVDMLDWLRRTGPAPLLDAIGA